ncbi:Thioredoxin [Penicillium sp. IBT 18751x]|nr:Thioredoxin [Penicillium sp. IBT 18751x]
MLPPGSFLLVASLLAALPVNADGIYTKKSPVLQVTGKTYNSLIANSNYTSPTLTLRFYAPWCGHCQNLKPAYEKAAQNLNGLAKVAAINCDEDENKPFCGQMGVQGFPTLKIVTPSKKPGKPRVEDYQGARTAKAIVDAVVERIPNHVKRVTDKDLDNWLNQNEERPKVILFTEKGTTSALIRAVAVDFLGEADVAQVRNKESASVEKFGVTQFPALIVVPTGDAEPQLYEGELKKQPIIEFLSEFATPNPDASGKAASSTSSKAKTNTKSKAAKSASEPSSTPDDESTVESNEEPEVKTAPVPISVPPLPTLATSESLESSCLAPKSGTCVLALLPEQGDALSASATDALSSLAEIAHKHAQRGTHLFPVYAVPETNSGSQSLRTALGLEDKQKVEVIALNARRGWWRHYVTEGDFSAVAIERWVDAIRLGEGEKEKLPDGLVGEAEKAKEAEHDEL